MNISLIVIQYGVIENIIPERGRKRIEDDYKTCRTVTD